MAVAAATPRPTNEDHVQSFHSGRVSGCVTLQPLKAASSTCSRNKPVRMASTKSPICTIRVFVIVSLQELRSWQARRDSNPQHAVLETAALPLELLASTPKAYLVSLWSVCLRQRAQNFGLTSLSVMVRLFFVVV